MYSTFSLVVWGTDRDYVVDVDSGAREACFGEDGGKETTGFSDKGLTIFLLFLAGSFAEYSYLGVRGAEASDEFTFGILDHLCLSISILIVTLSPASNIGNQPIVISRYS